LTAEEKALGNRILNDINEGLLDDETLEQIDVDITKLRSQSVAKIVKDRPLLKLGFGVTSFFELLDNLVWVFFFLTLIALPQMYIYESGQGYGGDSSVGSALYTVGNLG
jgi:hypothetical protein